MKYTDPDGRSPLDLYDSIDEAAEDFSNLYNDDSIRLNTEFGTSIYRNPAGQFYYSIPNIGDGDSCYPYTDPSSENDILSGFAHTHGAYDPRYANNFFSDADMSIADNNNVPIYVGTPNGSFQKYDGEVTLLSENLFSDDTDPDRRNERSFSNGEDNEYQLFIVEGD